MLWALACASLLFMLIFGDNIMLSKINVAVLGAGPWAQRYHLPALKILEKDECIEIAGIWNRTIEKANIAANQFNISRVYNNLDEVINDKVIDCYIILVHSDAVFNLAMLVNQSNLPIFIEKPPGNSFEQARQLAENIKVQNVVAFNRRYMPINQHFYDLVSNTEKPYFAECHFYRNAKLTKPFILETGIHGINFMEYFCGAVSAISKVQKSRTPNGEEFWICDALFESGIRGILKFFSSCGSNIERYELHSDSQSLYLYCPQIYTTDRPGRIFVYKNGNLLETIYDQDKNELETAGFLNEYRDFFSAIRYGTPTKSNFINSAHSLKIAELIQSA